MKKMLMVPGMIALLLLAGCLNPAEPENDDLAAVEVAESLSNEQNGAAQELSENLNLVLPEKSGETQIIITSDATLDLSYVWNPDELLYVRSLVNLSVSTPRYYGTVSSFTAKIQFLDGSGDPVELGADRKVPESVQSIKYSRKWEGILTRISTGVTRNIRIDAAFTVTGLNDGNDYGIANGVRTVHVTVTKGMRTGEWTMVQNFRDVKTRREKIDENTRYISLEGTVDISFNGEYTGPRGTLSVSKNATVVFKREKTVSVTVDGNTVIIDIVRG